MAYEYIFFLLFFVFIFCILVYKAILLKRKKEIEGIARMVQITQQQRKAYPYYMENILNFRIESTDKEGNIINLMQCEMRGLQILGNIVDGDRVKVKGKVVDGLMRTKEIINITTNSIVKVK